MTSASAERGPAGSASNFMCTYMFGHVLRSGSTGSTETGVSSGLVGCLRPPSIAAGRSSSDASSKVFSMASTCVWSEGRPSADVVASSRDAETTCCRSVFSFCCLCTASYRLLPMIGVLRSHVTSCRSLAPRAAAVLERAPVACAIATSLSSSWSSSATAEPAPASYACGSTRSIGMPRSGSASSSYLCAASAAES